MIISETLSIIKFITSHPLNRNNKVKAVFRFLFWQIYSRFFKKKKVFKWIDNSILVAYKSESAVTANFYTGMSEFYEMGFLMHCLRSDNIFVDIGANSGIYTVLASKVIGSKSICIEPIHSAVERIKEHVMINQVQNLVTIHNIGLGHKEHEVMFTSNHDCTNHVIPDTNENDQYAISQKIKTLNSLLNLEDEYVLKIDTEGYEFNILKGANKILSHGKILAIIIEVNGSGAKYGITDNDIHTELKKYGYSPIKYDPLAKRISNIENLNDNNFIYIKDSLRISERVSTTSKFKIHTNRGYLI